MFVRSPCMSGACKRALCPATPAVPGPVIVIDALHDIALLWPAIWLRTGADQRGKTRTRRHAMSEIQFTNNFNDLSVKSGTNAGFQETK